MLDNPDGDVMVELSLNLQGLKATKPIKSFSALTHLPHKSAHSTCEPRDVAVLVKNTELQQQMEAKGDGVVTLLLSRCGSVAVFLRHRIVIEL